jgi:hypothetical protein
MKSRTLPELIAIGQGSPIVPGIGVTTTEEINQL